MTCPKCHRDYKDPAPGKEPGFFYHSDNHFGMPHRRFGMVCTYCGFIAEFISKATGEPYTKRKIFVHAKPTKRNRKNKRRAAA